jgi:CCR4-NOT transcriptional regulation complex NOT5 subunit
MEEKKSGSKKKGKGNDSSVGDLQRWVRSPPARHAAAESRMQVDRHNWHLEQLDTMRRRLEADEITIGKISELRDDINYYVDSNQDPDFVEDETLYEQVSSRLPCSCEPALRLVCAAAGRAGGPFEGQASRGGSFRGRRIR